MSVTRVTGEVQGYGSHSSHRDSYRKQKDHDQKEKRDYSRSKSRKDCY
jgi:hypothetical protein